MDVGASSELTKSVPAHTEDSRLKVHLRLVTVGGHAYRVVTLRPGTHVCYSTNFYHQTWHIVSSQRGARLLARLLWGLSYQRHAGTLVLVHGPHLALTPFEAERSDAFLLVPAGLTPLDSAALRALKGRLCRLGPPTKTIRWQTFGLDAALRAMQKAHSTPRAEDRRVRTEANEHLWDQERMHRLGGFICYSAPAPVLRCQALRIYGLRVGGRGVTAGMDYHYLADGSGAAAWCDGEVQIFADYHDRVAAADEARRQLLPNPKQPVLSEAVQEAISRQRDLIQRHKLRNRRAATVRS
jgi:hypothetical protein